MLSYRQSIFVSRTKWFCNMQLIIFYFVSCFLWTNTLAMSLTTSYFDGLVKYLKKESKLHQVVFVRDGELNNIDPMLNSLMKAVNTNFPSLSITYDAIKFKSNEKSFDLFYKSRPKTLFVLHYESDRSSDLIFQFINHTKVKSYWTSLPRCLIINSSPSERESLKKVLTTFWRNKFLDVTILSPRERQLLTLNATDTNEVPIISKYNPFFEEFLFENVSSNSQWFPNKLRNLNGYKLNFYNVKSFLNYSAPLEFTKLLAHGMNFNYSITDTNEDHSDFKLSISNFVFEGNESYPDASYSLKILGIRGSQFVIPNTIKYSNSLILSGEFWYMLLATIGTTAIICLVAFFMRFKKSTWEILNISQVIMGMSTEEEPRNLPERIVFGSLLIACMVYSGYLYSVILDISWRPEHEISNLRELADSNLIPIMHPIMKSILIHNSLPHLKKLGGRALESDGDNTVYNCWRQLVDHQNVSCLFSHCQYFVNELAAGEDVNVKILPEMTAYYMSTFQPGFNSPYQERFNEIIQRAYEFGLLEDFFPQKEKVHKIQSPEKIEKDKLFIVLFSVLIIGYSLSVIAFLLEILQAKFGRRLYAYNTRFRFAN